MNNNNNNGRGIFYGVIGVATLIVAIIGATFAYFTATASNENGITGNAANVTFGIGVTKVTTVDDANGLIPMSNSMVEAAVSYKGVNSDASDGSKVCMDDNGNAVCQIYKITLTNTSAANIFVDGYVALLNGMGTPTDYTEATNNKTTMRWAQVFKSGETYTTEGTPQLGATNNPEFDSLDLPEGSDNVEGSKGKNAGNILTSYDNVKANATIDGNSYEVIGKNYIRVSDHKFSNTETLSPTEDYDREADVTSALVYNQKVEAATGPEAPTTKDYYIVVWLSETGTEQTGESSNFFKGQVKFISASGGEVSATFSGFSRVPVQTQ